MAHGGARNRSGPAAKEMSGRSDRRGYSLTALPTRHDGAAPKWPLAQQPTEAELAVWEWAWTTPQACAWSMPSEAWRVPVVAQWVRVHVRCSDPEAPASLFAAMFRLEDRIGLSTAGLAEMGWKVVVDETATKREAEQPARPPSSRDRMSLVKSDGA